MMKNWLGFFGALIISALLAFIAVTPLRPQGPDIAAHKFSSARAMIDVNIIAAKPHPTGSAENAKLRAYLQRRLTALGLEVSVDEGVLDQRALARLNRWSGAEKTQQNLYNIIGLRRGTDPSLPALLLMAHHDTVWDSPGAADDTIGIAAILETLRALNIEGAAARDVIILFTDAEEIGLVGARHFFESHPLKDRIGLVINLEARGGGGTANMFQTSDGTGDLARLYARAVRAPSASSLSAYVYKFLPNGTDLTEALERGYTAYNIANIGKAEYYHSPKITAQAMDEATLQHMGVQILDLTRALVKQGDLPRPSKDAVFFDVYGLFMLVYAPFWGWICLALSAAFYGASVKGQWRGREGGVGSLKMLGFFIGGGVLLYGLNRLSGSGASANYYDRLAAISKLEILALIFVISFAMVVFGRKTLSVNMRLGAALPLLLLGIAGQALAPTATYFISLPLMFCGFIAWAASRSKKTGRFNGAMMSLFIASVIGAGLTAGYLLALGHLLMLGVGAQFLFIAVLPAALAVLALLPLCADQPKALSRLIISAAGLSVIALALWIRLDPIAATVPLY